MGYVTWQAGRVIGLPERCWVARATASASTDTTVPNKASQSSGVPGVLEKVAGPEPVKAPWSSGVPGKVPGKAPGKEPMTQPTPQPKPQPRRSALRVSGTAVRKRVSWAPRPPTHPPPAHLLQEWEAEGRRQKEILMARKKRRAQEKDFAEPT